MSLVLLLKSLKELVTLLTSNESANFLLCSSQASYIANPACNAIRNAPTYPVTIENAVLIFFQFLISLIDEILKD